MFVVAWLVLDDELLVEEEVSSASSFPLFDLRSDPFLSEGLLLELFDPLSAYSGESDQ